MKKSSIEELGGRKLLEKAMKVFYDKVYEHPWLGLYFKEVPQEVIEKQQVDFMIGAFGGPKSLYSGRLPVEVHQNMLITDELFDLREKILLESLEEIQAPKELIERWFKIDEAFRAGITKKSIDECTKSFATEEFIAFDKDGKKVA
jgi:hemoglobin